MPTAYQSFVSQHWNKSQSWGDNISRIAKLWKSKSSKPTKSSARIKKIQSGGMMRLLPYPISIPQNTWGALPPKEGMGNKKGKGVLDDAFEMMRRRNQPIGTYIGPDGKRYVTGRPDLGPINVVSQKGGVYPPRPGWTGTMRLR